MMQYMRAEDGNRVMTSDENAEQEEGVCEDCIMMWAVEKWKDWTREEKEG